MSDLEQIETTLNKYLLGVEPEEVVEEVEEFDEPEEFEDFEEVEEQ